MAGLDLTQLATDLGNYTRKYSQDIMKQVFHGIQLESMMTPISGVTDEYVASMATVSEILQPFHADFQAKGTVKFTPRVNKVRQIKGDVLLSGLDDLHRTYLAFLAEEGVTRDQWPIVRYITQEMLIPKMIEELDTLSATGDFSANTGGTASAMIDSVDGILTIIADEITATNITPIATGAITRANILDKVDAFVDAIPTKEKKALDAILVSETLATWYGRAYKETYGTVSNYNGNGEGKTFEHNIDNTDIKLVGVNSFGSSQRMVASPKKNMLKMYDQILLPNRFEFQRHDRTVKLMIDFKRGWGFGSLDYVYVNDQA